MASNLGLLDFWLVILATFDSASNLDKTIELNFKLNSPQMWARKMKFLVLCFVMFCSSKNKKIEKKSIDSPNLISQIVVLDRVKKGGFVSFDTKSRVINGWLGVDFHLLQSLPFYRNQLEHLVIHDFFLCFFIEI